jgi:hypothetical protein
MSAEGTSKQSKIWIFLGAMLAALHVVDFIFCGHHAYDLIAGAGFVLAAIGACFNGVQTLEAIATSGKQSVVNGYAFAVAGCFLVVVSIVLKYAFQVLTIHSSRHHFAAAADSSLSWS